MGWLRLVVHGRNTKQRGAVSFDTRSNIERLERAPSTTLRCDSKKTKRWNQPLLHPYLIYACLRVLPNLIKLLCPSPGKISYYRAHPGRGSGKAASPSKMNCLPEESAHMLDLHPKALSLY